MKFVTKSNIKKCGKVEVDIFNENSPSSEHQQNSEIQGTNKGTEGRETKASGSQRSRRIEDRKNIE